MVATYKITELRGERDVSYYTITNDITEERHVFITVQIKSYPR